MNDSTRDPVCGMRIDTRHAASTATVAGRTYYFCSPACAREFAEAPQKYTITETTGPAP